MLDEVLSQPLALVVAPAGAGKTVLLEQWAETHPDRSFVWLDIVPADNDPAHFAAKLVATLSRVVPHFLDAAAPVSISGRRLGETFLEVLPARLRTLPETVIVLDDVHQLTNRSLLDDLERIVEFAPPNIHTVFSTRMDLPLGWSRHRLNGDLVELRSADLAFDFDDSAELLARLCGRPFDPEAVAALVTRTEGWVAGLQLAAMTMKGRDDPEEFIEHFGGTDRLVADYLTDEVLRAQPSRRRTSLLRASAFDEMSADLITEVTGEDGAQSWLESLERESMFLVPLDTRREWFRFHNLFRDLLRYHLRAEEPGAEPTLLAGAADWYLARGDVQRAVEYLLRAREWERALTLVRTRGAHVYERGELRTVIRWMTDLPDSVVHDRLDRLLLLGFLHGLEGQVVAAADPLRRVMNDPDATLSQQLVAHAIVACEAWWSPRPESSVDAAKRSLALLDANPGASTPDLLGLTHYESLRTMTLFSGGRAHFLCGDLAEARRWLELATRSEGADYAPWRISSLGSLALVEAWCGRLGRAEELATEARAIAEEANLVAHPSTADAYLASSLVAAERSEPEHAERMLAEGVARAAATRRTQLMWIAHLVSAMLGQTDSAAELAVVPEGPPPPVVRDRLTALRQRERRLSGRDSLPWAAEPESSDAPATRFEQTAYALAHLQPQRARALLGTEAEPRDDEPLVTVERLLLRAWLADVEGRPPAAERRLGKALALAEEHALVDVFLRAGPHVVAQLAQLPGQRSAFVEHVLERAATTLAPAASSILSEPLTERELEILACLPSRSTNGELADRFYVSVNTIKTHMVHIYRKLDVPNRSAAIVRAQELGLLR
ncbi:AAA family ATPase [Diaminobutyricibacter tongyongensis]|uniref:AAA family ATPase n=1 Tax=Leifsonia tongyongensis TaxID=1268043 RepID=A0A6L9XWX8_9MICO|nr:AAA family ATPase [Diaminobutyricibacter tongyongensis]